MDNHHYINICIGFFVILFFMVLCLFGISIRYNTNVPTVILEECLEREVSSIGKNRLVPDEVLEYCIDKNKKE